MGTTKKVNVGLMLLAGEGQRLRPHTQDRPKCLVELNGIPLLRYQLNSMKFAHITNIFGVVGYKAEKVIEGFPELRPIHNVNYNKTNIVESFYLGLQTVLKESPFDSLVVSYGDIIYSKKLISELLDVSGEAVTVTDDNAIELWKSRMPDPLADMEKLKISKSGAITEISGKPKSLSDIDSQYIGLTKFSFSFCKWLSEQLDSKVDLRKLSMTELFQNLIKHETRIQTHRIFGGWMEVDTIGDLTVAHKILKNGKIAIV